LQVSSGIGNMGNLIPGGTYIYESPDGGLTTYARLEGSTERVMIGQSWQAKELVEQRMWNKIYPKRKSNPALTEAVEKCIIIYKLSEENNDGI
jgi:hypothetical protein